MSKKHYVWAAQSVIDECRFNELSDFTFASSYIHYLTFFKVFGTKFNQKTFDTYIVNQLSN